MSIKKLLLLFLLLPMACAHHQQEYRLINEGEIGLQLRLYGKSHLTLTLVNRSLNSIDFVDLFDAGYVQSPIEYRISRTDGGEISGKAGLTPIPLLVDLEKYRATLGPQSLRGTVLTKREFVSLYGLEESHCYSIQAVYKSAPFGVEILPSEVISVCF